MFLCIWEDIGSGGKKKCRYFERETKAMPGYFSLPISVLLSSPTSPLSFLFLPPPHFLHLFLPPSSLPLMLPPHISSAQDCSFYQGCSLWLGEIHCCSCILSRWPPLMDALSIPHLGNPPVVSSSTNTFRRCVCDCFKDSRSAF